MAINVYNSALTNQLWYTDKCKIVTTTTPVTYQVYATALGTATAEGNIYAANETLGANEIKYIYVGVGNYLTITGSNFTAQEVGTASSAQAGTGNFTENLTPPVPAVTTGSIFIPGTSSRVTLSPGIVAGSTSTTPFTVEGWFYSTVTPGTDAGPVLLSTDTASANPTYAKALTVNLSSTTAIVVDSNGAAAQTFTFAETMLINTWYYVAVTRDSSGYIRVWMGKKGDTNATASITDRVDVSGNISWNLTGLSNTIGAFVPAGRYTTGYISNLRVDSTSLYTTTAATIPMPTEPFTELAGTVFLQNTDTLTDETGNQTLTAVGSAAGASLNPF
jgi:hypothetical protein